MKKDEIAVVATAAMMNRVLEHLIGNEGCSLTFRAKIEVCGQQLYDCTTTSQWKLLGVTLNNDVAAFSVKTPSGVIHYTLYVGRQVFEKWIVATDTKIARQPLLCEVLSNEVRFSGGAIESIPLARQASVKEAHLA